MYPANPEEIEKVIKSFKVKKVTKPNSIHISPVIIRNFKKELFELFCLVVNLSFSEEIFPDPLKCAKVFPIYIIYKKQDPLICNNYRPISLLSNIKKLCEKLIYLKANIKAFLNNIIVFAPNKVTFVILTPLCALINIT